MNILKWKSNYSIDCDIKYQSLSTRKTYKNCVSKFLNHFITFKEPKSVPTIEIKKWLLTFETLNTRKQMLCAVNSFYKLTVGMPSKIGKIPYPKKQKTLPRVIDTKIIKRAIKSIPNIKHQVMIMFAYALSLRRSEVLNVKIEDINSDRMEVYINNAKGQKDRVVKLPKKLLKKLRVYYLVYRPEEYLFNGQSSLQYSATSFNNIVKKYLGKEYTTHTLRHSGATTMLENGTDISLIQVLLGHNSIKTTRIYTHISKATLQNAKTPYS